MRSKPYWRHHTRIVNKEIGIVKILLKDPTQVCVMASFTDSSHFMWQTETESEHNFHLSGDLQENTMCHPSLTVSGIPCHALIGSLAARCSAGHDSTAGCREQTYHCQGWLCIERCKTSCYNGPIHFQLLTPSFGLLLLSLFLLLI